MDDDVGALQRFDRANGEQAGVAGAGTDKNDAAARAGIARAEQALLRPFCRDAAVAYLLARGVTLTRRFIDRDGRRFFDVSLTARDCATTPGESSP